MMLVLCGDGMHVDVGYGHSGLFLIGISNHGIQYLTRRNQSIIYQNNWCIPNIPVIENNFELIKRPNYPDLPSRYISLFIILRTTVHLTHVSFKV